MPARKQGGLMRSKWKLFLRILPSLAVLATAAFYLSCDSSARIFLRVVQYEKTFLVSATPV